MSLTGESLVLYTDGGCLLELRAGGWGFHGYAFEPTVPKQGSGCPKAILTAKGYQTKDGGKTAASPVTVLRYVDGFGSIVVDGTNNVAELQAAIEALKYILATKPKTVIMFCDSKYVIEGLLKWYPTWIKNEWKNANGADISNKLLWLELIGHKDAIDASGIQLDIEWVKGHSDDVGNDRADRLATYGLVIAKKGQQYQETRESDGKGYWTSDYLYNRFVDKSRWYFNSTSPKEFDECSIRKKDGRFVYHLGNHGPDDELLGKPIADASFAVVYLKDKITELELIRNYQNTINNRSYKNVIVGKLDKILSANMLEILNIYKDILLQSQPHSRDIVLKLSSTNETQLTKEMNPAHLAFRASETLNNLENILDDFIENPEQHKLSVTEITDIFYGNEIKGKKTIYKLKPEISSAAKKVDVGCHYNTLKHSGSTIVPLLLGIDTPSRNALSALADCNPRLYVVTWRESDLAFHYATVLRTNDDVGIWAGVYSNLRLITP